MAHSIYRPLSEATTRKAFRTNFTDYHIVPYGCRHFFSTQDNESGLFSSDVIEATLSQWRIEQLDIMRDGAKVIPFKQA